MDNNTTPAHVARTRGKRTTTPATTTSEAYLKTVMAALDCNDPALLAEKAQSLQGQVESLNDQAGTLQLALVEKGNELSRIRGETREYRTYFDESFKALKGTHWSCDIPIQLSGKISGLRAGWEIAKNDADYFQNFVLKTCAMLGTNDPKLIQEKLQLILSRKDELDNLTRTAQLCLLPQWRPAKRENLAEAVTNLCDSWTAAMERMRDLEQKNADLKREYEAVELYWEPQIDEAYQLLKGAIRSRMEVSEDELVMPLPNLVEALATGIDVARDALDKEIASHSRLPFWARALAGVVWTATVFAIAHKMGFEAHAIIGGGK